MIYRMSLHSYSVYNLMTGYSPRRWMIGIWISHMCFAPCLTRPPSRFLWCKHKGSSARKIDLFLRLSVAGLDVIRTQADIVLAICSWNSFLHLSHKLLDIIRTACNMRPNSYLPVQNFWSRASTLFFTRHCLLYGSILYKQMSFCLNHSEKALIISLLQQPLLKWHFCSA